MSLPELLEQGLALVRERAARQALTVSLDVGDGVGRRVGGRDQAQAGRREPAHQRGQVHAVRRVGGGGAWLEGEEAVVTVRDTGVGIAAEDQARIFEAFQRGDRRVSVEGTGLGLTLSKRFVELHGGRMWVESAVGVGLARSGSRSRSGGRSPEGADVLLIEDDRRSAELFQLYLEGAGYRVSVARDGADGLELARSLRPRAVVLDLLLPGIDGWDVLGAAEGRPERLPGGRGLDARRALARPATRRGRVPGQAGLARGRCSRRLEAVL